jgi:hypothetical protein
MLESSTRTPAVVAAPVKECPLPTGLTTPPVPAAVRIRVTSSSVLAGWATAEAMVVSVPAQLRQASARVIGCELSSHQRRARVAATAA